jgi:hypothetical protein
MAASLGYCTVGSNRLEEAKRFYDALLGSAGITPAFEHPSGGRVYGRDGGFCFGVLGAYNGAPASVGNGAMVSFRLESREEVDAFHASSGARRRRRGGAGPARPNLLLQLFPRSRWQQAVRLPHRRGRRLRRQGQGVPAGAQIDAEFEIA